MTAVTTPGNGLGHRERRNLVRHFFEMVAAMLVGMAALGLVVRAVCAALGYSDYLIDHVGLRAPLMAMNMSIGMAVWMRHRGHGWAPIGEMSAAMFGPLLVTIGPFLTGALPAGAFLATMHILMLPAMVMAMLHRRDEYAQDHRRQFAMSHMSQ